MSKFDDIFEKPLNLSLMIGAISGAIIGFSYAGIGGAILGIILGAISGLAVCLLVTMIGFIVAEPLFLLSVAPIIFAVIITISITALWDVGKP